MSFYFNGSGYTLSSDYAAIDFTGNFSLFAWVNPDRVNSGDAVFCKWNNDNTGLQQIRWRVGGTGKNEITIRGSSTTYGPIQSSNSFTQSVWNSCGATRSGTGTNQVSSWLNGTETQGTASQAPQNTSQVWQIAQEGTGNNINGYIAELGVWNVALSAPEMSALCSGVAPPMIRRASLVYYVPFIMNAAALDLSGSKLTTSGGSGTWTENLHPPVGRMMPLPY